MKLGDVISFEHIGVDNVKSGVIIALPQNGIIEVRSTNKHYYCTTEEDVFLNMSTVLCELLVL